MKIIPATLSLVKFLIFDPLAGLNEGNAGSGLLAEEGVLGTGWAPQRRAGPHTAPRDGGKAACILTCLAWQAFQRLLL